MHHSVLLSVAAAAEHPLIDIDLTALVQLGIFLCAFAAGSVLVFRPYLRLRDARAAGIEGAREEAVRMVAEADARLADYEQRMDAARNRGIEEKRKIRTEAVAAHREVVDKAKADATATVTQARDKITRDVATARQQLMPSAEKLSRDVVAKLLGREVAS